MLLSVLKQAVTIRGRDIFGRPAWIKFSPCKNLGWYWAYRSDRQPIAITRALANSRFRRICLEREGAKLEFFEHIGSLFFTGLTGVVIESSTFPPYHGRPLELWEALKSHLKPYDRSTEWLTFKRTAKSSYDNGRFGYVEFSPHKEQRLDVTVIVDYPKFGHKKCHFSFPSEPTLERVFAAHTIPPVTSSPAYLVTKAAQMLLFWQFHRHVIWPQDMMGDELLEQIALHRVGDILGAASLTNHRSPVAGKLISFCGGHKLDTQVFSQIQWEPM